MSHLPASLPAVFPSKRILLVRIYTMSFLPEFTQNHTKSPQRVAGLSIDTGTGEKHSASFFDKFTFSRAFNFNFLLCLNAARTATSSFKTNRCGSVVATLSLTFARR